MHDSAVKYMVAVLAAALWQGMIGVMVKWIPWPPFAMVSGRCFIAAAALWAIIALRRARTAGESQRPATPLGPMILGGVLLAAHWGTLFWGYRIADVGPVVVAVFTYPVMTSIAEPLLARRRPATRQIAAASLGVVGVGAIALTSGDAPHASNLAGIALGLLSAALYAARNIHARYFVAKTGAVSIMAWQCSVAAVALSPALLSVPSSLVDAKNLSLLAVLALAFTVVPHTLLVWALNGLSAATVGIIGSLQAVSGVALAVLLLGEITHVWIWLGAFAVVGAVAWESVSNWRGTLAHRGTPGG